MSEAAGPGTGWETAGPDTGWAVPGYQHVRSLGTGASGQVVLAVHQATGRKVAVKYLAPRLLADRRFVERFRAEARLLAGLDDAHLVRFYDYVESPHGAAIVMELVAGPSLRSIMNSRGALAPEAALVLLKGSLLGLAKAHQAGVVHRDYKPENILVPPNGTSKLADFGVAVPAGEKTALAGTPAYMAPEQWAAGTVSPATDVYAATVVFFECLAGSKPYQGTTLDEWAQAHQEAPVPVVEVPEALRGLVTHGMAKDPSARPVSAAAFVDELETTARAAYGRKWEKRGRRALAGLAAGLLSLLPRALADQVPKEGSSLGQMIGGLGKGSMFTKPVFLVPTISLLAVITTTGMFVAKPWEPASDISKPGDSATASEHASSGSSSEDDDDGPVVRERMEKKRTANFTYRMDGCCSNTIWASGSLDRRSGNTAVHLDEVYDGRDGAFPPGGSRFIFNNPEAESMAKRTRAYVVGSRAYTNVTQGWRTFTTSSAKYQRGEDVDSENFRYKTAASDAFSARGAASAKHIAALLEASGKKAEKPGTYRGSTTTAAVIGRAGVTRSVYGELTSNQLDYTLVLGKGELPTRLEVKVYTPGGNSQYWQYRVTYSGWGTGERIEPPGVPKTQPPQTSSSPQPPPATSKQPRRKIIESPGGRTTVTLD